MKKILLSLAVLAGFAADAQTTNSDLSQNAAVTNGYRYEYSNLSQTTPPADGTTVNCIDASNVFNTFSQAGYTGSFDANEGGNGALKVDMSSTAGNIVLKFTAGNCGNVDGSPIDISGATNKVLTFRVKSTVDMDNFLVYPIGIGGGNIIEYGKGQSGGWLNGVSATNTWAEYTIGVDTLATNADGAVDLTSFIGVIIAPRNGLSYVDGTFYIDYITMGDAEAVVNTNDVVVNGLNVYPNPATDVLNVNFDATTASTVELTDLTGKVVSTQNAIAGSNTLSFTTASINAGVYFVNIKNANGNTTQKVIIK